MAGRAIGGQERSRGGGHLKRYIRLNPAAPAASTDGFEIFRLALSARARNLLGRLNIKTLSDLRDFGTPNIRDTKGCGRKTYNEISAELEKLEAAGPDKYLADARVRDSAGDTPGNNLDTGAAMQTLMAELGRSGFINSSQAQRILGLDSFAVRPLLRLLVERGIAVKEGRRRGMRYIRATR